MCVCVCTHTHKSIKIFHIKYKINMQAKDLDKKVFRYNKFNHYYKLHEIKRLRFILTIKKEMNNKSKFILNEKRNLIYKSNKIIEFQ